MSALTYRREIDGLRAVAVLAVLLYHAGFNAYGHAILPGGYIGVDVFFVISGYLITSIILRDLDAGHFSFGHFYLRRARRILPALLLVIACTTLLAITLLDSSALREYFGTALAALWSGSNFLFWLQDGYYAAPSELKPLLHTWSLSVEEQFYLIFPCLLVLLYRHARSYLLQVLVFVALCSLVLAQLGSRDFADANFFLLPARAWELLAGAMLAQMKEVRLPTWRRSMLCCIGLLLIGLALCLFSSQTRHPSLWTALPVLGAMLLIRYSGGEREWVTRFLRSRPLVCIGLLSYGLYLWHYPLFALYRYTADEPVELMKLALLGASFALATLSYHVVEKPIRFSRAIRVPTFVKAAVSMVLVLSITVAVGYNSATYAATHLSIAGRDFNLDEEKQKRFKRIEDYCADLGWDVCNEPLPERTNVLIVGDSLVDDAYNILDAAYPNYHFIRSTIGGCPPHPDLRVVLTFELPGLQECLALNRERFDPQNLDGLDGVVIDIHFGWFTPQDLEPYLAFLDDTGVQHLLIFGNYITLKQEMPETVALLVSEDPYLDLIASGLIESAFPFEDELTALAASHQADFLSLKQAGCTPTSCVIFGNDYPYTWDQMHFSLEFSGFLSSALAPQLEHTWLGDLQGQAPRSGIP